MGFESASADAIAFANLTHEKVKQRDPLATRSLAIARRIYDAVKARRMGDEIEEVIAGGILEILAAELASERKDTKAANAIARIGHLNNVVRFLESLLETAKAELQRAQR